jgi:hypothetical protein
MLYLFEHQFILYIMCVHFHHFCSLFEPASNSKAYIYNISHLQTDPGAALTMLQDINPVKLCMIKN